MTDIVDLNCFICQKSRKILRFHTGILGNVKSQLSGSIFPGEESGKCRVSHGLCFGQFRLNLKGKFYRINKNPGFVGKLEKMRTLCTFCNNISEKDTKRLKYLQFAFLPVSVRKMVDKWQTQYYNKCINA